MWREGRGQDEAKQEEDDDEDDDDARVISGRVRQRRASCAAAS